eukprot:CAMPEP_0180181708 /NCGR_PEP_ID=MMETSP0986-20121125/40268_1 /TAXON_ID=697907 /ORGANISM="non described non described, Strain CCMP2293" /LENGTH=113 /DNA_ID=CAMNT_0022135011 /DNA_START=311 /DNA_END=652 /DNA_ORIENTATION=+
MAAWTASRDMPVCLPALVARLSSTKLAGTFVAPLRRGAASLEPIGRPGLRTTTSLRAFSSCCNMGSASSTEAETCLLVACAHVRRFHTSRTALGVTPKHLASSCELPAATCFG